eukprot:1395181-Amorphochlora_amoeboformis.AAC.1
MQIARVRLVSSKRGSVIVRKQVTRVTVERDISLLQVGLEAHLAPNCWICLRGSPILKRVIWDSFYKHVRKLTLLPFTIGLQQGPEKGDRLYPSEGLPRVQFETKIFHPMIHSSSGELDIKPAKFWEKRDPTKGYMDKLLRYVKEIFFFHEKYWKKESKGVAGFKLCANPTAARMYIKDHQRYRLKCQ